MNEADKVNEKVNDRVIDQKTGNEEKVLELLTEDPGYTITQLATELGVGKKNNFCIFKKAKRE